MEAEQTVAFLSSMFALLGSLMLVLPAFRADRYLSSAQLAKSTEEKIKALSKDDLKHGNLVNALAQLGDQLSNNARQWTPTMSWMLRGGIFFTLLSGVLRIWGTWPAHG